jgi:ACS family glucarate transporter-like MFS transporter
MNSTIRTAGSVATAIGSRRGWILVFLFLLNALNYLDRVVISVDSQPIAKEFGLSPVELGYLFSSFLWSYVLCMVPVGIILAEESRPNTP